MTRTMYEACTRLCAHPSAWRSLHHLTKRGLLTHQWVRQQANGMVQLTETGEQAVARAAVVYAKPPPAK